MQARCDNGHTQLDEVRTHYPHDRTRSERQTSYRLPCCRRQLLGQTVRRILVARCRRTAGGLAREGQLTFLCANQLTQNNNLTLAPIRVEITGVKERTISMPARNASQDQFVDMGYLETLLGVSRRTIYKWIAQRHFPKPFTHGSRTHRWIRRDVEKWIASKREPQRR